MRVGYLDSSMVLGLVFEEPGCELLGKQIGHFPLVFSSNLLEAEVRSALHREGIPDSAPAQLLGRINWVFPDRPLTRELSEVLSAGFLRGADLWHLACALYLSGAHDSVDLLTLDTRQERVARRLGLVSA